MHVLLMLLLTLLVTAVSTWAETPPYGVLINDLTRQALPLNDETTARLELAHTADASWIRIDFPWAWQEPTAGNVSWSFFDNAVDQATSRGLRIMAILWGTPSWAGPSIYGPPTDLTRWDTFVTAVVSRYQNRGIVWEIWNEPDTTAYWKGSVAQYVDVLRRAYTVIKAINPAETVALGGLAQAGSTAIPDFLQQILGLGAGNYFDWHNIHTSFRTPTGSSPSTSIPGQITWNRTTLSNAGFTKPVVVTESSYTSEVQYQTLPGYVGGGEATQARYLTDAYNATLAMGDIPVIMWASLVDFINSPGAYSQSGLAHLDKTPKLAFTAFQSVANGTPPPPPPPPADTTPPAVTITAPTGTTVARGVTTTIAATASDTVGVASVTFAVNDTTRCTVQTAPYTCAWAVPGKPNTTYQIIVTARDAAGNVGTTSKTVKTGK